MCGMGKMSYFGRRPYEQGFTVNSVPLNSAMRFRKGYDIKVKGFKDKSISSEQTLLPTSVGRHVRRVTQTDGHARANRSELPSSD